MGTNERGAEKIGLPGVEKIGPPDRNETNRIFRELPRSERLHIAVMTRDAEETMRNKHDAYRHRKHTLTARYTDRLNAPHNKREGRIFMTLALSSFVAGGVIGGVAATIAASYLFGTSLVTSAIIGIPAGVFTGLASTVQTGNIYGKIFDKRAQERRVRLYRKAEKEVDERFPDRHPTEFYPQDS